VNLSTEQLQMGALIDAKMQMLLREGHDEVSIIGEMFDCMPLFKMLLDSGKDTRNVGRLSLVEFSRAYLDYWLSLRSFAISCTEANLRRW
jgi:hypothetical protein